jgi:hypothetical protein
MKKVMIACIAVLAFSAMAVAQVPGAQTDVYQVNYFSNNAAALEAGFFSAAVRIVNPGVQGTPLSANHGRICADIYVFDTTQEMLECCRCPITANGYRQIGLFPGLTGNPLTGVVPDNGVIKIVADATTNCNEQAPTPVPDLRAWATHYQAWLPGTFFLTEEEFQDAPLTAAELQFLGTACSFVQYLGSGAGVCSCSATLGGGTGI